MALVNLAAFMGQAMRKTIIYDASNENNWDKWHPADIPKAPNIPAKYLSLLWWVLAVGSWDKIMLNMIAKMRVPETTLLRPKVKVWGWSRILESPTKMSKWCMWRGTISLWGPEYRGLCSSKQGWQIPWILVSQPYRWQRKSLWSVPLVKCWRVLLVRVWCHPDNR